MDLDAEVAVPVTETRGRPITNRSSAAQARRNQYHTLRGAWLCAWSAACGKSAALGSPFCGEHRDAVNVAVARLREERRASDLCQHCGAEVIGRVRCWLCSERRKSYASRQPEYRRMKERTRNGVGR